MARDRYFRYEIVGLREGLVQTAWRNVGSGVLNLMDVFLVLGSVLLFWARSCCCLPLLLLLLLLLLFDMDVSCHRPFLPGTSLEPAVILTAQASSFTLQYFPYYV